VKPSRYRFGTVHMSCVDLRTAMDCFFDAIDAQQGGYIACTCTHGIVEAERDERMRVILNHSLMTLPDGMPTVWMGRLRGAAVKRVTAPDFMTAVIEDPRARAVRHYFYGASPATVTRIAARAGAVAGRDAVVGSYSPPVRPAGVIEDAEVIARIAEAKPDVIWVGLGLPKQEYWMEQHRRYFPKAVLVGVGAAFDWYAGDKPRAPLWMQSLGLEWLHRVATEPARLWPRYRAVVPLALAVMAKDLLRLQKHAA
jgi:N-acetylglucosaminyldiphosphoundecaprenol N-acetyl-beta-D-mannosaminyltransferase